MFAAISPLEIHLHDLPALPGFTWSTPLDRLHVLGLATLSMLDLSDVVAAREIVLNDLPALTSLSGLAARGVAT
ncbi:hypothetical protein [Nannocystis punicea]|uniref:Uncharacterized protein n=1 Tax=Nannocystis punicea TaxID=2995304 RepID=A0ABY7H8H3_9BACT|nr:hypothetical protein [Nannocystis poenicansa]WAS95557.1 hypothetical protein O0S08_05295 [Nannocystis poenicansa]